MGHQAQSPHLLLGQRFQKRGDRIDGNGENRSGIFFRRDFDERLEIAQLQCGGVSADHVGRISEALGGFEFFLRVNDLRATFALRFRLTRDGLLHLLWQVYILDFYCGDFDAPGFRLLIDDPLEIGIDLIPFREKVVELALSQHATERGLRHHGCGVQVVFHLDNRALLVYHPEVDSGIHLDGDVVFRNDILGCTSIATVRRLTRTNRLMNLPFS